MKHATQVGQGEEAAHRHREQNGGCGDQAEKGGEQRLFCEGSPRQVRGGEGRALWMPLVPLNHTGQAPWRSRLSPSWGCPHPALERWFEPWLLHSCPGFLPTCLGRQKMAQVFRSLPHMWATQIEPLAPGLSLA